MRDLLDWWERRRQSARIERAVHHAFRGSGPPPLLIYQMGKVGSLTVLESLSRAGAPFTLFHVHSISNVLATCERAHETPEGRIPDHVLLGAALARELARPDARKCRVVSLVRDPMALLVSNLFENPHFASSEVRRDGRIDPLAACQYLRERVKLPYAFDYVFQWFEREMERVFDIDVFEMPFPGEGCLIIEGAKADLLMLRAEDLNAVASHALARFLGVPGPIELVSRNVREDGPDAEAYRWVKAHLKIDSADAERIYSSPFVAHFYDKARIDAFRRRWTLLTA